MNHLRTFVLLAALTALFVGFGYMLGGPTGMLVAFVLAAGMNLFSYWNADRIVLAAYRAQPADPDHADARMRDYVRDTLELADRAGLPRPKVYVIDNPQPNAFATGRSPRHAAVAATTGLLQMLDRREIRGVMAHELAHVRNLDTLTMTVTATVAGAISALANFALFFGGDRDRPGGFVGVIVLMILGPMAAGLVQMAISRHREYEADRAGADICGDPDGLASALEKIEAYARRVPNMAAENNPATAHLFIINPLGHRRGDNLFSTHPNTANRVAALRQASGRAAPRRAPVRAATAVPVSGGRGRGPWG